MKRRNTKPAIIDINLLPRSLRPVEVSPRAAAIAGAMMLAVVGILPLSVVATDARADASAADREADAAEARLEAAQVDLNTVRTLRIQLEQAEATRAKLKSERAQMQGGSRTLGDDLAFLWGWGFLPEGAVLTTVSGGVTGFSVTGRAAGPLDAIAYAGKLVSDGGFPEARMTSFTPGTPNGTFIVEVSR